MCRADPAQFPLLSSSPDSCTHWAERQWWESGVAGRRHDGHMWSCGGLPQEKRSKLTGNDTTETLTQYKFNFTVTNY